MTKEEYQDLYYKYSEMDDEHLKKRLTELYKLRYEENNTDVFTEHRIAARVQLERNRDGGTLIFHMNKFVVK